MSEESGKAKEEIREENKAVMQGLVQHRGEFWFVMSERKMMIKF